MDLNARSTIQIELDKNSSFKAIALMVGKDCTTISKEVRTHRIIEHTGAYGKAFNDCELASNRECNLRHICERCLSGSRPCWSCGKCTSHCILYKKKECKFLSKPPYVCNPCPERQKCSLSKAFYRADTAQSSYKALRSEARSGFATSEEELKHLDDVISPLVCKGQSLHHICIHHRDELMRSERTLYTYVNNGLFSARNIDMPRTVRMRPRKTKPKALKVDKTCRIDRTYEDFKKYLMENPDTPICQLDTVEGIKGGSVLLTVHFVQQSLQLAFLRQANDSQSVIDVFDRFYIELGPIAFMELFPLLLADNGSEFSNPKAIEFDGQGNRRTRLYYCNPSSPHEKGSCENNHELIRRCIPKGVDIGNYSQQQILLMMSHINCYSRKLHGNKSPYDVFAFQYSEDILKKFGLVKIPADEIILSPELFK